MFYLNNIFQLNAKFIARQVFVFVGKILISRSSKIANLSSCGYIATRSTRYVVQWGCQSQNLWLLLQLRLPSVLSELRLMVQYNFDACSVLTIML